ncbi:MAG: amidase, partial [Candidatus Lokiarchaeota archaeon]|nr:amidase [Candidatus Lokiarchaeota archaeon]MBD3340933.1 amidase [Candidatus Lokiarchaeota archaeon]
ATLDHYGPIVRNVKDAALMLDVIAGPHDSDRFTIPRKISSYLDALNELPKNLKIGYSTKLGFVRAINPEVKDTVETAAKKFEDYDWLVEEVKVKIKKPELAFNTLVTSGLAYDFESLLKDESKLDDTLIKMIQAGLSYSAIDVKRAENGRENLYEVVYKHFKDYDILITPTTACPPFGLGMMYPPKIAGKAVSPVAWMSYTYPFNMSGNPAASIPCGWTKDGLPIGMQIIGPRFEDLIVLQVSQAFEDINPWQEKKPKL